MAIEISNVAWNPDELTLTVQASNPAGPVVNIEALVDVNGTRVWDEGHHFEQDYSVSWPITLNPDVIPENPKTLTVSFMRHDTNEVFAVQTFEFGTSGSGSPTPTNGGGRDGSGVSGGVVLGAAILAYLVSR